MRNRFQFESRVRDSENRTRCPTLARPLRGNESKGRLGREGGQQRRPERLRRARGAAIARQLGRSSQTTMRRSVAACGLFPFGLNEWVI
jgi:hypothetical protein